MANKKFSEFTLKTDPANVDFVVGYDGTDNVRIDPSNLGGGNPAGSDTQLQYNNGGTFGAIPGFTYNDTNDRLIIDTTRVVFGDASGSSFQNGLTIWDDVEFRGSKFELSDGSAANPILTFFNTGDNNTGMFRPGSDIIAFATGGQEEFRIGANGEIGLSGANFGTAGQVLTSNGTGSGASWTTISGGGATSLNGLSDCLVDTDSLYVGGVPSGLSGNPQGNTVLGIDAGNSLTTGIDNTFVGNDAGLNQDSSRCTIIGQEAGFGSSSSNSNATNNTFIGWRSGYLIEDGGNNTFIGKDSGRGQKSGDFNVAIGQGALYNDQGSNYNIAIGASAMANYNNTGSQRNTVIGSLAASNMNTNKNCTLLGYATQPSSGTVQNEITLGSSSVSALRCAVTSITSLSDERDKSEIKDLEYGLAFIDALQPREFVWDNRIETKEVHKTDENGIIILDEEQNPITETQEFYSANKGKKDFGFIAQEVRELDNDTLRLVYSENEEKLEMSYGKLVPILVKAIQELKEEVELLKG